MTKSQLTTSLPTVITILATVLFAGCANDTPPCQRCDFIFYWDSTGALSATDESCREIDCDGATCGLCTDITYNENDQPVTGTCDSCIDEEEPDCGIRETYCPTHPDECAADGVDPDSCGCYDLFDDERHCGACFFACPEGDQCSLGQCVGG